MSWTRVKDKKYIPLTNERVGEILGEIIDESDVYGVVPEEWFEEKEIFDTICYSDDYGNWTFMKDDIQISINMELYTTQEKAYVRAKELYFDMIVYGFKDISEYDAELDLLKEYLFERIDSYPEGIITYPPHFEKALPKDIIKLFRTTGDIIYKANDPFVQHLAPWTFEQWKEERFIKKYPLTPDECFDVKDMERMCPTCNRKHLLGLVCINPINGRIVPLHELKL